MNKKAKEMMRGLMAPVAQKTIALNVIVGPNEAAQLKRCLDSADKLPFDEIVVCLTSNDPHVSEVAKQYATTVARFDWTDNFAEARNACMFATESDYIMWMDADDIIPEDAIPSFNFVFKDIVQRDFDYIKMLYEVARDEAGMPITVIRERIIKRKKGRKWNGRLHEGFHFEDDAKFATAVGNVNPPIVVHRPTVTVGNQDRNIRIYEAMPEKERSPRFWRSEGTARRQRTRSRSIRDLRTRTCSGECSGATVDLRYRASHSIFPAHEQGCSRVQISLSRAVRGNTRGRPDGHGHALRRI